MGDTTQGVEKLSGLVTAKNTDIYVLYLGKRGVVLTFIPFLLKYRVLKCWLLFPSVSSFSVLFSFSLGGSLDKNLETAASRILKIYGLISYVFKGRVSLREKNLKCKI